MLLINSRFLAVNYFTICRQDAKLNEVDSGTELDSQGEDETEEKEKEEPQEEKNDEEKKDD